MLYSVSNPEAFKELNLVTWRANTAFWLEGRMRHIHDLSEHATDVLSGEVDRLGVRSGTLIDVGCGEAWLLRILRSQSSEWRYIGLDFNDLLIAELKVRHAQDHKVQFLTHDIEHPVQADLRDAADVVVCSFSLFEVPRLEAAMSTIASLVRAGGGVVIFSIEPLAQLIAISANWEDLRSNLSQYEALGPHAGYDKDIDVGCASGHVYRGILYSLSDYIDAAAAHGLRVRRSFRIIRTITGVPQVYETLLLRRERAVGE